MNLKAHWQELQNTLNYHFKNSALLKQAFTHRSHHALNNERLEYLGDALLETIISNQLYHRHPKASEGELTRLRAALVREQNLASIARHYKLGNYLLLGLGERKAGGARRDSILADCVEALIAAVYLDSDFANCEAFTLDLFADSLANLPSIESLKDAKTRLQEYLQSRGYPLPEYQLIERTGPDHNSRFTIAVKSAEHQSIATASSRKKAEQQAAELLLKHYQGQK